MDMTNNGKTCLFTNITEELIHNITEELIHTNAIRRR